MEVTKIHLSIQETWIKIAGDNVPIKDLFVKNRSFQSLLKTSFPDKFSKGRFREPFLLLWKEFLGGIQDFLWNTKGKPASNATTIVPLYGCTDGCCLYIYTSIKKIEDGLLIEKIGRNSEFIFSKDAKDKSDLIRWLEEFNPLFFTKENFNSIHKNYKSIH